MKTRNGVTLKGKFCPYWGGVDYDKSMAFFTGGLEDVSVSILAGKHTFALVEVYEDPEDKASD